jgi:chromosome segregation ATPase
MGEVKDELVNLKDELAAVKDEFAVVKDQLAAVSDDNIAVKDELASNKDELAVVKDMLASVKDELASVADEFLAKKDDLASIKDELAGFKDRLADAKGELADVKENYTRTSVEMWGKKGRQSSLEDDFSTNETTVIGTGEGTGEHHQMGRAKRQTNKEVKNVPGSTPCMQSLFVQNIETLLNKFIVKFNIFQRNIRHPIKNIF